MDCASKATRSAVFAAVAVAAGGCGCRKEPEPPFPDHLRGFHSAPANPGFNLYTEAAEAAEKDAAKQIVRTTWTPGQKDAAVKNCNRALGVLSRAQGSKATFVFAPTAPGLTRTNVRGWRFLGRALKWKTEKELEAGNPGTAAALFLKAARMGAMMSGGDAMDAGLGFVITSDCAQPLWQSFPSMGAGQLSSVYGGLSSILRSTPRPETTLENERWTMLAGVQWVQDSFTNGDFAGLSKALGVSAEAAVKYLRGLKSKSALDQVAYFNGFAREAEDEASALQERAAISPSLWTKPKELSGERPWRRFAANLFATGSAFLAEWAEHQARMRLMAVDAAILARYKAGRGVPKDLRALPQWLRTDPFSGRDFVFIPQGPDYKLYSIGPDRKDDGGERGPDITVGR